MTAPAPAGITVVVTTLDDERFVRDCLDSLVGRQDPALAEVIVVDRGSADATASVVRSVAGPVRLLDRPGTTAHAAEDAGRAAATGGQVAVAPVRALFAAGTVATMASDGAERLSPVGTTAFGRAVAATAHAADGPALPARGWYFVADTPGALAHATFAGSRSARRGALVAGSAALAVHGPGWVRLALPLAHAGGLAVRALRAGRDQGVAPHRAFLAGEIRDWCGGVGWWAGRRR